MTIRMSNLWLWKENALFDELQVMDDFVTVVLRGFPIMMGKLSKKFCAFGLNFLRYKLTLFELIKPNMFAKLAKEISG